MKNCLISLCLLLSPGLLFASTSTPQENANIALIKEMLSQYAEKLDNSKIDDYFSKTFVLVDNDDKEKYDEFKKEQETILNSLKSFKVLNYHDMIAKGNKVAGSMSLKLSSKNGLEKTFQVMFIAQIKNNKIENIWEVTYPAWDDKLTLPARQAG